MPIDIVKKNKKQRTVNLKKRQGLNKNKPAKKKEKESLEEKLEKRFANLPNIAEHQKIKMMWVTVIIVTVIIVFSWFYLVSHGVILRFKPKQKDSELGKLTEDIAIGFNEIKEQFSEGKDVISTLKNRLETEHAKNELINSLKKNLEKQIQEDGQEVEIDKVVSQSGNLIVTYPLPDYYIDNPVKILGRGRVFEGEFEVKIKDSEDKILGQMNGMTQAGMVMSSFEVELNYTNPTTETGVLELYTLSPKDGSEQDLVSIPVKFIVGLEDWQVYGNEEWGIGFRYPDDWANVVMTSEVGFNYLQLNNKQKLIITDKETPIFYDSIFVHYYRDIGQLNKAYSSEDGVLDYQNLQSFTATFKGNKEININGLSFNSSFLNSGTLHYFIEKKSEEIFDINSNILTFNSTKTAENQFNDLSKILATFKFIEPNLENWKEYKDIAEEVSFKYPPRLTMTEELGQTVFRAEEPDDLSFYFFAIEPQIDDLKRYVEESSVNLEEEIIKSEVKNFGDAIDGIYYQAETIQDIIPEEGEDEEAVEKPKSVVYMFNHYGVTYSIRTNKDNFPNTFANILNSIEFKTSPLETPEEEALREEFLEKYME